ncbi:zinc ABC transporter ATP-binding protein AztA [Leucobacter sp. USHLN153]|uniref:zinc ABC transporter ATP-binding protein AztA n=1 Tax=Leucobacter sp. USHLN153 TaxID=3081268 RepID=UPI003015E65D
MDSSQRTRTPVVELAGIRVCFGARDALAGVDADFRSTELAVIVGPNGAGKSTLLEVIAGTQQADEGERRIDGILAFVPQRAAIPPGLPVTVRDVVNVGVWGRLGTWRAMDRRGREAVDRALDRLDILGLAKVPFSSLSGGQQQRTLLAQGLVREADILLLDEPTTALDSASSERIRGVMRDEAARGVAVVCVSHDESVIDVADRVIRLADGRVDGAVAQGIAAS